MSASHPTFASGHCFMAEPLSKPEVEFIGELLHSHLREIRGIAPMLSDPSVYQQDVERINEILRKMDHPLFEA